MSNRRSPPRVEDLAELRRVEWKAPADWTPPLWFEDPPNEATLPMTPERMDWCLWILGWTSGELSRRLITDDARIRKLKKGKVPIPDVLAIWLEQHAAASLSLPTLPKSWRPRAADVEVADSSD